MKIKENITPHNDKNQPHGKWIYYYSNGQLRFKANYINGKPIGYFMTYSNNGRLDFKEYHIL